MSVKHIAIFGGTFDPPHRGHKLAVETALKELQPDLMLVIPTGVPPHKEIAPGMPNAMQRFEMAELAFAGIDNVQVSDIEVRAEGVSYTYLTVRKLMESYPEAHFTLIMGSDMFLSFHTWREAAWLCSSVSLCVMAREHGADDAIRQQMEKLQLEYGVSVAIINIPVLELSSTQLREALPKGQGSEYIEPAVMRYILRNRLFGAKADADWLRCHALRELGNHRLVHTLGCEYEAVRLARRWGADEEKARIAAILHDCTKAIDFDGQLKICAEYGITEHGMGKEQYKLFHAITGAAVAQREYAAEPDVVSAIRWHTTGRPNMTTLEKVIYIADFIEPGRNFLGVEKVRSLAYRDLDAALLSGFELSLEEVRASGAVPHEDTINAMEYIKAAANR